jgi:transposase
MNKSDRIRRLLAKGLSVSEIAKQVKVNSNYVHTIKWLDKKKKKEAAPPKKAQFKSPRSKLIQSVFQTVKDIEPINKQRLSPAESLLAELNALEKKPTKLIVRPQHKDAALKMLDMREVDLVNKPPHYTDGGVDTLKFIEAKDLNYRLGNVVKYISRAGKKVGSDPVQDLEKARFYLEREIEARRDA